MNNFFLKKLQGKDSEQVDEAKLRTLAGQVKRSDFEDEDKLRQIIQSLAALTGKKITAEKEDKIIEMFRNQEISIHDMSSITKLLK
ncbi:hypothetical protein BRE01_03540 [Brevibacillus reuszeri]|uniref:Stage VI sporulation protein F n=1 Tax=Brevibacillus reuszeri TaxID=54915 RepID=A0A0K9YR25_9BACL|nr:stage VI sporulation protein F [Brevibacillus reuszeri]KNB71092.1 hypothetical protein ADS79_19935 [Brevibacillus reuszeri]MED1857516.1 stage VI sporulation protein F [Brevibacillus reuszeri]GED66652.1 hypothetical protein BRE01_03540 [Brevibacillus reuszeri]